MSAFEFEVQPDQVLSTEETLSEATQETPEETEKSGVIVDPQARNRAPPRKFQKGDTVHLPIKQNGLRMKGRFTIYDLRYTSAYWEYRLRDPTTKSLYDNAAWVRERELTLEKRAGSG